MFTNSQGSATPTTATLTVIPALAAPVVTINPANQSVNVGQTATFTAAASGNPTPTVQWQVSTNGGTTFTNVAGATSTTLSFVTTAAQTGNKYRAVFTNSQGSATTTAATLMVNAFPYDGNYTGTFIGNVTVLGQTFAIPGTVIPSGSNDIQDSIVNGVATISLPGIGGSGTGTLNSNGTVQFTALGAMVDGITINISFSGALKINSDNTVTGTGTWTIVNSAGITGSGTWSVSRPAP